MKKHLLFYFILFVTLNSYSQSWQTIGGLNAPVHCLQVYNNELYAGGWFSIGTDSSIAKWDGTGWISVGNGVAGGSGPTPYSTDVTAMAVYNGDLYVAGDFTSAGGTPVNHIAKWNGTSWSNVSSGMNYSVDALCVYNGELYACGSFDDAGGINAKRIAKWNGVLWLPVGTGITTGTANCMAVYNNQLYVGGAFGTVGGQAVNYIASWDGSNWHPVNSGLDNVPNAMCSFNNELYVGGRFTFADGLPADHIAKFDGTQWLNLNAGVDDQVNSLTEYNGNLYVSGHFDNADGIAVNKIAKWNGASWSDVSSGLVNTNCSACAAGLTLAEWNSNLVVAGSFNEAGGTVCSNISLWNTPTGILDLKNNRQLIVYPNPTSSMQEIKIQSNLVRNVSSVRLYNSVGIEVVIKKFYLNDKAEICLKSSELHSGLYHLVVIDGDKEYNVELLITD